MKEKMQNYFYYEDHDELYHYQSTRLPAEHGDLKPCLSSQWTSNLRSDRSQIADYSTIPIRSCNNLQVDMIGPSRKLPKITVLHGTFFKKLWIVLSRTSDSMLFIL